MNFSTSVSNNLFIANDTGNSKSAEANFGTTINQQVPGLLEPVSTINGISYFYSSTSNVLASGNVKETTWIAYDPASTAAFNTNYNTSGAVGYIDYVYQLKGVAAAATNINLNKLNLVYGGDDNNSQKAYRVAVFAQDITGGAASALAAGDLLKIYTVSGAVNFESGKAVKTTSARDDVSTANVQLSIIDPATAGYASGTYYKITVRLWLEGDDNTCNNTTFMHLTDKWRLDMGWAIDDGDAGTTADAAVTVITQSETASKVSVLTSTAPAVDAAVAFTIGGVSYYATSYTTYNTDQTLYVTAQGAYTASTHFFTYVGGNLTDVTNEITVTTT